jgi:hypothetical protein
MTCSTCFILQTKTADTLLLKYSSAISKFPRNHTILLLIMTNGYYFLRLNSEFRVKIEQSVSIPFIAIDPTIHQLKLKRFID